MRDDRILRPSERVLQEALARCSLGRADHVDECAQRGGRLPSALIVKINALDGRRPPFENTYQLAVAQERFDESVERIGDSQPVERRLNRGFRAVDGQASANGNKLLGPVPFESPAPELAILGDAILDASV